MTSSSTFRGASLSSSPAHQRTHDVLLSFGADTRHNFTSHLYAALNRRGISTYLSEDISYDIEELRASVIILSENYASSLWCLKELQKILKYKKTKGQIVIPVFYKVNPSDVRLQKNNFGEAFTLLRKRFKHDRKKVQRWKAALSEVAIISGLHLENNGNGDEAQCVDEIVQKIANHVNAAKPVAKHSIAIKSPLHVPDSSSSPAQVPDSSSSPSPVEIQAPVQVVNLSGSPSRNGEQGPSISSVQGSNSFSDSSLGVIALYIGLVIGIQQLGDFETHPINIWISHAALAMFCFLWLTILNIDGTRWAKYSGINKIFCVPFGLLVPVSLVSINLPHQLWWLFFVVWALLGVIFVAGTWIYSGTNRRNDEEIGLMMKR